MASENKTKFAVLVHQLPLDCRTDALALLPNKYIENVTHDVVGLRIYFKVYDSARESILQRTIRVRGISYTVCPLVTNLTLHNIRKYAPKSRIRDMMSPFGSVIDLYPIEEVTKEGKYETKSLTDDYRVILDVPEVHANFNLSPLWMPDLADRSFPVSFFCRLCRQNGHMQHQCPQCAPGFSRREPSLQNQHCPGHRRASHETDRPDTLMNRARYSSSKKRMPAEKNTVKTDPVGVKEEQDSSYNIPFVKFEFNETEVGNVLTADHFTFKSETAQSKDFNCDNLCSQDNFATPADSLKIKEEVCFEQQCCVGEMAGASNMSSDEVFLPQKDIRIRPSIHKGEDHGKSDKFRMEKQGSSEKIDPFEERNKKKQSKRCYGKVLRHLVPPDTSLKTKHKLLKIIFRDRLSHEDIPPEVEFQLQKLLDWNRSRDKKQLKRIDKTFIKWLERYLAKVRHERNHSEDSERTEKVFQPEEVTGGQPSDETAKKHKSKRQRAVGLTPGIEQIVLKTTGVLSPPLLLNFLNQVRGRKKQMEIANHFTTDFPALFNQLEKVEKTYYLYGKRGTKEDRDIDFMQRLRNRLIAKCNVKEEAYVSNEESCFMRQSCSDKRVPKESTSNIQKNKDCNGQSAEKLIPAEQSKSEEDSVEAIKSRLHNNVSNDDQSSRGSTAQSSTEEFPAGKFKLRLQSNLSRDVQRYRRSSSTVQSSTEDELPEDFKWVMQRKERSRKSPLEGQFGRISSGRKRSSSGEDPPGKCQMNCPFYSVQSTSKCNDTWRTSTDEESLRNSNWGFQRDLSVRRSSCTTQSSTDEEPFENFRRDLQRNLPFDIQTTSVSNVRWQTNINEESPEISTLDLRRILSCVNQPPDDVQFQRGPTAIPQIKTNIKDE